MTGVFAEFAPKFRERGLEPRPVEPGGKACKLAEWQKPDTERSEAEFLDWMRKYGQWGVGLRMGTLLPDGSKLGALDIDSNDHVRVARTICGNPICGRFGSKGIVYFVRVQGGLKSARLKVKGEKKAVLECLFEDAFCVVPPTIHPTTGRPYKWIGQSLLDVDFNKLPLIGE